MSTKIVELEGEEYAEVGRRGQAIQGLVSHIKGLNFIGHQRAIEGCK